MLMVQTCHLDPTYVAHRLGLGEDIDEGIALSAGSFYTLFWAIQDAFSDCDVAGANGDVDRLLFENGAIRWVHYTIFYFFTPF